MAANATPDQSLLAENAELRARLEEAEEALRAIRCGEVDALVIDGESGPRVFTLQGVDAESNRFRGEILAQVSDAVIVVDDDKRVTFLNAAAERQYGVTASEVLGRHVARIHETRWLRAEDEAAATDALREHGEWRGESIHIRRDGRRLHVESSVSVLRDTAGQSVGRLAAIRDITGRKLADEALAKAHLRLQTVLGSITDGLAVMDKEWRFSYFSKQGAQLLGVSPEDMIGGCVWDVFSGAKERKFFAEFHRAVETRQPLHFEEFYPDPIARWIECRCYPSEDGLSVYFGDITERKRAEEALHAAKNLAETANQAKDRFLAVLSHELRTPLTPVLMAVGALEHDPGLRPDVREDIIMIKRNVELETKLIDDLLDLNRIASGKIELKTEAVDLNAAIRSVCGICHQQLLEQNVRLETQFSGEVGFVAADPARLQQVLWNVLKNAVKFTPADGIVRVSTALLDDRREVRVSDTGIGIPPDALPRIFEAFEQGDGSVTRRFGGMGLGLAISRALVELQGGTIRAESDGPGHGATFVIELPGLNATAASLPPELAEAAGRPGVIRLLLVEDHADTARTLTRLLRAAGCLVTGASSVADALAIAEQAHFDVVVSDLGLPDGSGCELIQRIRATRAIPCIAMSGYGMDEDVRRSRMAGFSEHLVKPIEVPLLIAAIRRVTENRDENPAG